jgi:hypothetical protein
MTNPLTPEALHRAMRQAQEKSQTRQAAGLADQEETDRRLQHALCVWCARKLTGSEPDDMFCNPECQSHWYAAKNHRPNTPPNTTSESPVPDGYERTHIGESSILDDPGPMPRWMGGPDLLHVDSGLVEIASGERQFRRPGRAAIVESQPLPDGWDYSRSPEGEIWPVRTPERPGSLVTEPLRPCPGGFALGAQAAPGEARLWEIEPEQAPEAAFPVDFLATLDRAGWEIAIRHNLDGAASETGWLRNREQIAVPFTLPCPRCGTDAETEPILITLSWPGRLAVTAEQRVGDLIGVEGNWFQNRPGTKTCCSRCRLPYPGVVSSMVPIRKQEPRTLGRDLFGWAHPHRASTTQEVTTEALTSGMAGDIAGRVWKRAYHRALIEAYPWTCAVPGCEGRAQHWVALAAPMVWQGHMWGTRDYRPTRWGMCPHHHHDLLGQALAHSGATHIETISLSTTSNTTRSLGIMLR